jgi:F-type H+-transporting ATPase subunit alpha
MDEVPLEAVRKFETEMLEFMRNSKADILKDILEKKALDADIEGRLKAAIDEFKKGFRA